MFDEIYFALCNFRSGKYIVVDEIDSGWTGLVKASRRSSSGGPGD